jgi:hypothetical protein
MFGSDITKALSGYGDSHAKVARIVIVCIAFGSFFVAALMLDNALRPTPTTLDLAKKSRGNAETLTHSRYPLADGRNCRETLFDRNTGDIIESATTPCNSSAPSALSERARRDFTWGK